jgi:hypothetical protein
MNEVRGFKVFNPDWTCRGFQYEVGKIFEEDVEPSCCDRGFHFCENAADCFNYYSFNPDNKVAEVIAYGDIVRGDDKCCTNKIKIVREIPWQELLTIVNTGKSCTGLCNTGDCNTGDCNTGDCNTGNRNTGDWNTGNRNTGDWNTGDCNTGNRNTGNCNTGDWNTGDWNTGDWNTGNRNTGNCNTGDCNTGNCNTGDCNTGDCNTGDWNTGDCNTGDWNTGDCNTGNCNTGDCNTGDCNTGNCNTGNRNTGDCNTGNRNTGDWNKSSFNTGCFNTEESTIMLFNKPSKWTYRDWLNSDARYLLMDIPKDVVEWVYENYMTEEEKKAHPSYKTTGGYLKVLDESECAQIWWNDLSETDRNKIKSIPNFDIEIFEQCTGIKIESEGK